MPEAQYRVLAMLLEEGIPSIFVVDHHKLPRWRYVDRLRQTSEESAWSHPIEHEASWVFTGGNRLNALPVAFWHLDVHSALLLSACWLPKARPSVSPQVSCDFLFKF